MMLWWKLVAQTVKNLPVMWETRFDFLGQEDRLVKGMAPHSSTLDWKIPWMKEPGRLQSMGSWRVGHNWATSLSLFTFMHWRRKWQPTPVFSPGESQGRGGAGGLPSMWLHRVRHDWSDLAAAAAACSKSFHQKQNCFSKPFSIIIAVVTGQEITNRWAATEIH